MTRTRCIVVAPEKFLTVFPLLSRRFNVTERSFRCFFLFVFCPFSRLGTTFNPILSAIISADCLRGDGQLPVLSIPVMLALVRILRELLVPAFRFILIDSAATSPTVKQEGSIMEAVHMKNTSATEMAFTVRVIVRITDKTLPPLDTI